MPEGRWVAKRKTAGEWRAFLRALRLSGNVRVAAEAAGMDVGTAYDRRKRDAAFAARMDKARAEGKARAANPPSPKASADKGPELIARRTKHGTQLVRAAAGRWNAEAWKKFRAAMRLTGCVHAGAEACGFSTTTLYERRRNYSDFAAAWAEDEAVARERLPGLLSAAAIAALDPGVESKLLPKVNVDQAIAIARLKGGGGGSADGRRGRWIRREPSIEEVRDEVLRRVAAIRRHREKGERGGDG